jgi:hypothetical protein
MDYGSRAEYDFAKLGGDEDSGKKDAAAAAATLSLYRVAVRSDRRDLEPLR